MPPKLHIKNPVVCGVKMGLCLEATAQRNVNTDGCLLNSFLSIGGCLLNSFLYIGYKRPMVMCECGASGIFEKLESTTGQFVGSDHVNG